MANPLSWLPFHGDKRSRRAALLGGALALSCTFHLVLPFVRWQSVEAISDSNIVVDLIPPPPMPLPEAEELVPVPNEETVQAPPKEDKLAATPKAEPPPPEQDEPEEIDPEPVEDSDPPEPPPPEQPTIKQTPEQLAQQAERDRRREERRLLREKRRAEREARRLARLQAQELAGGRQGGAPPSGDYKTGKPDAVYMCNATDKGTELKVSKQRPLTEWITVVPTVLAGFETRPGIGGYIDDVAQIITRNRDVEPKRLGFVELSLPNDVLQLELEEPRGVRVAVGRLDARCLVGFRYASKLFPFTISRAPVRIIDSQNRTVSALVDVTFFKDVSLELVSVDGTDLPFKRARLKNGNNIQRNIQDHYEAARLAKGIAEAFGIKLGPQRPTKPATSSVKIAPRPRVAAEKGKKAQE